MAWKKARFAISGPAGQGTVSGFVRAGLGIHSATDISPKPGRHAAWRLTHLRSGLFFVTLNVDTAKQAQQLADLFVPVADWTKTNEEMQDADPLFLGRLLGIKHTLGGDFIEFARAELNDPANIVPISITGPRP